MSSEKPPSQPSGSTLPEPSPVEFGGRVELRLIEAPSSSSEGEAGTTRYAARWFTADQKLEGQVAISPGPDVSVESPADLPEWLGAFTTTLVRTTARQAQKDNTWPRRLTRWRKAPLGPPNQSDKAE